MQLIDSTEDDRVVAQEQLLYIKRQVAVNCDERFDVQLLYPHRPKLLNHTYFIRINAYEIDIWKRQQIQHRASWHSSIPFPFLPVNKLALYLSIPVVKLQTSSCNKSNTCIHGECLYYYNSPKYFCNCDIGWSGSKCDREYDCQCSPDSICVDGPTNCVCPIDKTGQLCYIKSLECNDCSNGAACIADFRYFLIEPYCLCPEEFEGIFCETRRSSLVVSVDPEDIDDILSSVVIHNVVLEDFSHVESRQTSYVRITPTKNSFKYYFSYYMNLIFIEFNQNYYLVLLRLSQYQDIHEMREEVSITMDPTNRCSSIREFLNETILSSPQIIRLKFYHEPCQVNLNLTCFYDETQLCICHEYYRTAACFNFDHHMLYDCTGINYCQNNGKCFQDDQHCPITSTCACEECFYGSLCQLTTRGFALSLESIIGYLIRPKLTLEKQMGIIKLAVVLTTVMLIVGVLLNLLAISTFIQRTTLEVGVGHYVLASSIVSLMTMIVFSLKFYTLLATQMGLITNATTLNMNCKAIEYLVTGQFVAGQFVADDSLQTIRRADSSSHRQFVADNSSQC